MNMSLRCSIDQKNFLIDTISIQMSFVTGSATQAHTTILLNWWSKFTPHPILSWLIDFRLHCLFIDMWSTFFMQTPLFSYMNILFKNNCSFPQSYSLTNWFWLPGPVFIWMNYSAFCSVLKPKKKKNQIIYEITVVNSSGLSYQCHSIRYKLS